MDRQKLKHNLILISYGIILFLTLMNISSVIQVLRFIYGVINPLVYGLIIAYLLNIPYLWFKEKIFSILEYKWGVSSKIVSILSLIFSYAIVLLMIVFLVSIIIPQLISSITQLFQNLPDYITTVEAYANQIIERFGLENMPKIPEINNLWSDINDKASSILTNQIPNIANYIVGFTTGIFSWIIGLIISIYLLYGKEILNRQLKRMLLAFGPEKRTERILELTSRANIIFNRFITGNLIDSIIVGIICFIGLSILRMPYTLLVSVIIGVTNIIPIFGPFIGAIPSIFIIFIVDPFKAFLFLIFIIALQQIDGNIIKPHVVGNSVGLPSVWVLLSIVVGGRLFGIPGMLIGVPTFALIYSILRDETNIRLKKR